MKYVLVRNNSGQNDSGNMLTLVVVVALFVWLVLPTLRKMCSGASNKSAPKPAPKPSPKPAAKPAAKSAAKSAPSKEEFERMTNVESNQGVEPSGVESPTHGYVPASVNESMYLLGVDPEYNFINNRCSVDCCQATCGTGTASGKGVVNNMTCNSSLQQTGCLCASQDQMDFLANRGGNN